MQITLTDVTERQPGEVRASFEVLTNSNVTQVLMDIKVASGEPPQVAEIGLASIEGITSKSLRALPINSMVRWALAEKFDHRPIDCDGPADEVLASVAAAYRDAVSIGQPPLAMLRRLTGKSASTVTRLAQEARQRGLLSSIIFDRPHR